MPNKGKVGYWRYGETEDTKEGRREVEYVALCNKSTFLRTLESIQPIRGLRGWVTPRMGITRNDNQIDAVNQDPTKMVKLLDYSFEVLDRILLVLKDGE